MKQPVRRKLSIDRPINDTDIWVVTGKRRYIGGMTGLKQAFDKDVGDYVCKVVIRFIDKRGDLVERYE